VKNTCTPRISAMLSLMFVVAVNLSCDDKSATSARAGTTDEPKQAIGGLAFRVPKGWVALEGDAKAGARREFAAQVDQGAGLKDFARTGFPAPHMDQFYICQKQPQGEGQIIAWTLELPPQEALLTKVFETEKKVMDARQAQVTSGLCRMVKVDDADVVRVDVKLRNGATATNLHFWSPDAPTQLTVIMVGIGQDSQPETLREADAILASMSLTKPPATRTSTRQAASADGIKKPAREYKTVTIGSQKWMAENLQVSTFRNGDPIPEAKTADDWLQAYKDEKAAWCYYDNDPKNGEKFGKLYNWYAVNDPRGLAPDGWHVATDKEWQSLITALGGMQAAFAKIKDSEGFAALPAGARYYKDASFNHLGNITFWWSATKDDKWNAWYHAAHFGFSQVGRDKGGMRRCPARS
jgi:uncharacterized protein (TIGR02145 family)